MFTNNKKLRMTPQIVSAKKAVDEAAKGIRLARELKDLGGGMFGCRLHSTAPDAKHSAGEYRNNVQQFQLLPHISSPGDSTSSIGEYRDSARRLTDVFSECGRLLDELNTQVQAHRKLADKAIPLLQVEYGAALQQLLISLKLDPSKFCLADLTLADYTLAESIARAIEREDLVVSSADGGTYVAIENRRLTTREIAALVKHAGLNAEELRALPKENGESIRFRLHKQGLFDFIQLSKLGCVKVMYSLYWSA